MNKLSAMLFALQTANELEISPPVPYEQATKLQFCGECKMLSVTERKQKRGEKHYCNKYNKQVYHLGLHPKIVRAPECDESGE